VVGQGPRRPPSVTTKFQAPAQDGDFVARQRLIDLLQQSRGKRLALIHGPAGFGKTTLAVQWQRTLQQDGVPVAWLTLDRDDNDVVWFLSHLIDAVRRVEPSLAGELVAVLEEHSDDARRYVLTELINQIAEHGRPLAIVLDDWHLIEDRETAAALDFLLDVSPPNLHLVITSRTRAPAIEGLLVRNQASEIDGDQLRFDHQESASFLRDLNALALDNEQVHQLWSNTDGWVAALQLASLSLRKGSDPESLIQGFSGRHHSIGDYLAGSVLSGLPADLLDFLLSTSICDRLCGDLATAVSGQPRGQAVLEELERRDLFLRPLDNDREWFRYHHLFASYLRRRLERDHPNRIVELHRSASRWFADHGLISEGVTHALAAGDASRAVDLVEQAAMDLVEDSRMATLVGLVKKLPQFDLPRRPGLQIAIAWANCLLQRAQAAQTALDHVRAATDPATDEHSQAILGEADVVQACIDVYSDRVDRAATLVAGYLQPDSCARPFLVAVSANIESFVHIQSFAYEKALERQRWADSFHTRTHGPFARVYGRCFAGMAAFAQLDLTTAGHLYEDSWALACREAGQRSHAARLAGALRGHLRYERGDIDGAEELLEECHELGAESGVADFMIATYVTLARIRALRGDSEEAWALLEEGARSGTQLALPRLSAAVDHERVRMHVSLGQLEAAEAVLASQSVDAPTGGHGISMAIRHHRLAMRARIDTARGDHQNAVQSFSQIQQEAAAVGWRYAELAAGVEIAVVLARSGDTEAATRNARPILATGARAGLLRSIIDAGPGMGKLLSSVRAEQRHPSRVAFEPAVPPGYLSTLVATLDAENDEAGPGTTEGSVSSRPAPDEPLSPREVTILRLLDRGLSNKEIARNLSITNNTVKWYLKSIYLKLDVARRGEAVAEGRRREILT
jgi:LuxR family maltose regulon positive regulatory protein/serine/threonine-protein kinase PknK